MDSVFTIYGIPCILSFALASDKLVTYRSSASVNNMRGLDVHEKLLVSFRQWLQYLLLLWTCNAQLLIGMWEEAKVWRILKAIFKAVHVSVEDHR